MKKNIIMITISIFLGIILTFLVLNKKDIYAKDNYIVYAFQSGAYSTYEKAYEATQDEANIIVNDNHLYKIYNAILKDSDLIETMIKYFENQNIDIYLKTLNVDKTFYDNLDKYEEILKKLNSPKSYNQINQSILNLYLEGIDTIQEYKANKLNIEKEITENEEKIKDLAKLPQDNKEKKLTIKASNVYELLTHEKIDMKKKYLIVHELIDYIIYDKKNESITIYYKD